MTLRLTQEVLQLGLRDPFRIARTDHAASAASITAACPDGATRPVAANARR